MTGPIGTQDRYRKTFLLLLVVFISAAFIVMVRQFLMTLLLAAIFSALSQPLFIRLRRWFRGRATLAALCTLLVIVLVIVTPLLGILGIVVNQALKVSESVTPWVQKQIDNPDQLAQLVDRLPGIERIRPYRDEILTRLGGLVGATGNFVVSRLSAATKGTVSFLFQFGILLYAMFYFLKDGRRILDRILYYVPLPDEDERRMVDRFVSVTRATVKGTLIIGVLQGALAGGALAIVGIQGAAFWGALMTVLSIIPGVGTAIVWVPAAVFLFVTGSIGSGIFLVVFCGALVGSVDNLLRPRLVGKDTQMHDLLILFATMGGIYLFGLVGFIVGPILAALFVTVWDIYGVVFRDVLPPVGGGGGSSS